MSLSASSQHRVVSAVALAFGVLCAYGVHQGLQLSTVRSVAAPSVKLSLSAVRMAPPTSKAPAAPEKVLPLKTDKPVATPEKPKRKKPEPTPPSTESSQAAEPATSEPTPEIVPPPLPTLVQPSILGPMPNAVPTQLPTMGGTQVPPAPDLQPTFPEFSLAAVEKPGLNILVLRVLVGEDGVIRQTDIVVPSANPLSDLMLGQSYLKRVVEDIQPPMRAGELRWLELRIDYATLNKTELLLP